MVLKKRKKIMINPTTIIEGEPTILGIIVVITLLFIVLIVKKIFLKKKKN